MIRQMIEKYKDLYHTYGRVVGFKLFRPENASDKWEGSALKSFEKGFQEVFEFISIKNKNRTSPIKKIVLSRIFLILSAILFFIYPVKSSFALELSTAEKTYLKNKGTIVFVSQTRYPPFEFVDKTGAHTGMCIELAGWMATELGFNARFTDTSFIQAQRDILSKKADVLTSFFYSKKRDKKFEFTQTMFLVPASIFVAEERTDIQDINDLNGKIIAMQKGDYAKEFLESKNIVFNLIDTKDFADATDLVVTEKADAVIGDEQIVLYHIFKNRLTDKIKKVSNPLYIGRNCMATIDSNRVLVNILKKGIEEAQHSGILEKINRKWIGTRYTSEESFLLKYKYHFISIFIFIFVMVFLVWFYNIRLRKAIHLQTMELQESEQRFRELAEMLPETVFEMDVEGNIIFVNRNAFEQFGYTRQDIENGLNAFDVIIPDNLERAMENTQKALEGLKLGLIEYTALRKNGTTFPVLVHAIPQYRGEKAIGLRGIIIDITETKRLETQLQQAQKMESIGTMAGGIAHDFNNLLMGIQGRISLMMMNKDSSNPDFEHLKGIEDYVKSAANLTRQLLGFARGGKYEVKPTDINELVKAQNRMFGRTKKEIAIHEKYEKNLISTAVDRGQIEQVLLNLYVNAWQAMPGGGNLYVQTENVTIDKNDVLPYHVNPGKYVKISVTDTGTGMDDKTLKRIFDPFFTTKEMGRGTGLGLASAYGIIKNHGGFINVYSEKGGGSTFNIYLPASELEIKDYKSKVNDGIKRGHETVLLVDDEDMIIDVGRQMLSRLGYNVFTAGSGKETIEIYNAKKESIDLVILDMIMPDMGGGETYNFLKKINPSVKVLLSSGYSINGQAQEIIDRGCNGFIQKPFNMNDLSQKIRRVLDQP